MTTVRTSADLLVRADGSLRVHPDIRLTREAVIACHVYPDMAPVLMINSGNVRLMLTVPDCDDVTGDDLDQARRLAAAVARYVAELETRADISAAEPEGRPV